MASPLDLHLKDGIEHLTAHDRWNVLTVLILHSNVRNRCWVGMDKLAGLATNGNIHKATDAKKWLLAHGAIEIVPYAERVGKEKELPPRQHVYQLTGKFDVDGRVYHYFHMNEETDLDVVNGDNINVVPIEIINGDNGSSSSLSKVSPKKGDNTPTPKTSSHRTKQVKKQTPYSDIPDAQLKAIIHAWVSNLTDKPINPYAVPKNRETAADIIRAGYTAENVSAFVIATMKEEWWQGKTLALRKVAELMPSWLKNHSAAAQSVLAGLTFVGENSHA